MHALFSQLSGLIGLLSFLNRLMEQAPLEKATMTGLVAGFSVYFVLLAGNLTVQYILDRAPSAEAPHNATEAAVAPLPEGMGQEKTSPLSLMDTEDESNGALAA